MIIFLQSVLHTCFDEANAHVLCEGKVPSQFSRDTPLSCSTALLLPKPLLREKRMKVGLCLN